MIPTPIVFTVSTLLICSIFADPFSNFPLIFVVAIFAPQNFLEHSSDEIEGPRKAAQNFLLPVAIGYGIFSNILDPAFPRFFILPSLIVESGRVLLKLMHFVGNSTLFWDFLLRLCHSRGNCSLHLSLYPRLSRTIPVLLRYIALGHVLFLVDFDDQPYYYYFFRSLRAQFLVFTSIFTTFFRFFSFILLLFSLHRFGHNFPSFQ